MRLTLEDFDNMLDQQGVLLTESATVETVRVHRPDLSATFRWFYNLIGKDPNSYTTQRDVDPAFRARWRDEQHVT